MKANVVYLHTLPCLLASVWQILSADSSDEDCCIDCSSDTSNLTEMQLCSEFVYYLSYEV